VIACSFPRGLPLACLVPPLIVMFPPQQHQRPSRREKVKSFIRNIFTSNTRASNSRAHDSPPNTASSSRPTSVSPANVSSRTDLVSGTHIASTSESALSARSSGKRIDPTRFPSNASIRFADLAVPSDVATLTLTGSLSLSRTFQATANDTSLVPHQIADHIGLGECIVQALCTDGLTTTRRTPRHVRRGFPSDHWPFGTR
jgi:hypothetical protein